MGWGVNDDETFAAILEEMIRRPVYNLAVSSYATNRELLRLERSGLVSKIDTVIIQYCGNDLNENAYGVQHALLWRVPASATSTTRSLFELMYTGLPLNRRLSVWIMAALKTPLLKAKDILSGESGDRRRVEDFASHYAALTRILSKFPWLESKRVIIFYADSPDLRYANFVRSENRSGLTFVDLSVGPKLHYALDLHLNKQGHRRIAEKLFRIVMSDARATNSGDVTIAGAQGQ
jgi:lysophospholipase L1-like esterase